MYIDEDGDVAHEFYVETKVGSKVTLKQISNQHLTPQVSNYLYFINNRFKCIIFYFIEFCM